MFPKESEKISCGLESLPTVEGTIIISPGKVVFVGVAVKVDVGVALGVIVGVFDGVTVGVPVMVSVGVSEEVGVTE